MLAMKLVGQWCFLFFCLTVFAGLLLAATTTVWLGISKWADWNK